MERLNAIITGIASYVPEYILTNEELSKIVDTTDEWIKTRIGTKNRHILKGEGMGSSDLGAPALKKLIEKKNINIDDIEVIICSTATPDYKFPSTASIIAEKCGIKHCFAFDIQAACSGFLYAMEIANNFVKSGLYKKIVVVSAEHMSSIVDYTDRSTCPIFGDGATAVLVEPTTEDLGVMDSELHTDGVGLPYLLLKAGGSVYPVSNETLESKDQYIHQEGKTVFKYAVTCMADVSESMMKRNNLTHNDIDWLVPHQANMRIIEATAHRMNLDKSKVMINIDKYANTSSASVPLALADWESKLKKGDKLIMSAFGAGFTWGSIYIKWAYDGDDVKR